MKLGGGTETTVPKKRTEKQISKQLRIMIRDGKVSIGAFGVSKKCFGNRETTKIVTYPAADHAKPVIEKEELQEKKKLLGTYGGPASTPEDCEKFLVHLGTLDYAMLETVMVDGDNNNNMSDSSDDAVESPNDTLSDSSESDVSLHPDDIMSIRQQYPSADETYVGFLEADD
ncbi:Hypp8235 [Branchiostoma lanceolatum]|uniref:Hypp8235 protein n=1 Tax=Branchiostoma lanceolatum TaxID=7740 RepID=A0A8J9Z6H2_BRALA|nr:Hypp8235 [Branchiostoma lanceolatum]